MGDNVTCEEGGTWSAWKEIENNCVHIPPPKPDDLLKADSCNVFSINGNSEDWYVFRRNPNQAFLKSNYDMAIASGLNPDDYYASLLNALGLKTYAKVLSSSVLCNYQVNSLEANKQYLFEESSNFVPKISNYIISTMNNTQFKSFGGIKNDLIFNVNNNDGIYDGAIYINSDISDISKSNISRVGALSFESVNLDNGGVGTFNLDDIGSVSFSNVKINLDSLNLNNIPTLTFVKNGGIKLNNFIIKNDVLTSSKNVSLDFVSGSTQFDVNNLSINNINSLYMRKSISNASGSYNFKNINDINLVNSKFNIAEMNFENTIKNTLSLGTVVNTNKITLNNGGILINAGISTSKTYINGDVYLDDKSNYDEALFAYLNGNIYGLKDYPMMDVNECNNVYVNGKNSQWKAFVDTPRKAFLYNEYKDKFNIITIRKNLLSNINKVFGRTNSGIECNANVMVENEENKNLNVTDKNITVKTLSMGLADTPIEETKNTVNIDTIGSVEIDSQYHGVYKGNITINTENSGNIFNHIGIPKRTGKDFIGDIVINGKYGVDQTITTNSNSSGKLDVSNVKNFNVVTKISVKQNKHNQFDGGMNLKNIANINLNFINIDNVLNYESDYPNDLTFINASMGTDISGDLYLNNYAFFTEDSKVTITGTIHDARVVKLFDADYCSGIKVNGSDAGWKYFETNPNLAFNTQLYDETMYKTKDFQINFTNYLNKTYFYGSGKHCIINIPNYNISGQKEAKIDGTNAIMPSFAGTAYCSVVRGGAGFTYLNELIVKDAVTLTSCHLMANNITSLNGNISLKYLIERDADFGDYYVNNVSAKNGNVSLEYKAGASKSKLNNVFATTYNSTHGMSKNVNLELFNNVVGNKTVFSTVGESNVEKLLVTYKNNTDETNKSNYIFDFKAGNFTSSNPIYLNEKNDVKFIVNNTSGSIYTDLYLNDISMYERNSLGKIYGKIYGGNQDYSSESQNP